MNAYFEPRNVEETSVKRMILIYKLVLKKIVITTAFANKKNIQYTLSNITVSQQFNLIFGSQNSRKTISIIPSIGNVKIFDRL